jgi:3-hydroxyisobutyrate dehydrogenase-like beta-hydroxyacid dehydrogenase
MSHTEVTLKASLGFIGLGLMGSPMAARLLDAGHPLAVFNRTKEKAAGIISKGAVWCESPKEVAERSDMVFSMLANSQALAETATGNGGVIQGIRKGCTHVDMSTVSPMTTKQLGVEYQKRGCFFMHSPVLGSVPQATDGSLLLFVGGSDEAFHSAEPVLQILGGRIWRFEKPEQASYTKLLCNLFIGAMGTTLAQALVLAQKADVNPETLLDILDHSSLSAPMYQTKGKSILDRNFSPRFFVQHMLKDLNLILDAGKQLQISLPGIEASQKMFAEAAAAGFGREDYSAVVKVLERQAGVEVRKP